MKRNQIANLVIFFITSISLKNVNCDEQLAPKQISKINLKISVLLPLLEKKATSLSSQTKCSDILRPDSLQTVTALYYALDLINRDETLSKNFTLTIDVIENCHDSVLGMRHLSNLIEQLQIEPTDAENATFGVIYSNDYAELNYETIFQSFPNFPLISCSGPPTGITDLNGIQRSSNGGFNTVTSRHVFIVDVVFEILKHYNWKYIAIYSPACDNHKMAEFFKSRAYELAKSDEVCIGHSTDSLTCLISLLRHYRIPTIKDNPTYDTVDVIICYCEIADIMELKNQLRNRTKKYVIIAGNLDKPWKNGTLTWISDIGELYYVTPKQHPYNENLYSFYESVENDTKQAYFKEFRERYLKRKLYSENTTEKTSIGSDTFRDIYSNNSNAAVNIIKSLYTMAHAIKNIFVEKYQLSRYNARGRLRHVNFELFDEEVSYTKYRGLPKLEKFDVHKFQETENISETFVKVGEYTKYGDNDDELPSNTNAILRIRGNLTLLVTDFQNSIDFAKLTCSKPCSAGYFKKKQNNKCCWDCVGCGEFEVSSGDAFSCDKCEDGSAPNKNKSACISISVVLQLPTDWTDGQNLLSIGFSSFTIVLTSIVLLVFVKYQNTPAVKSTTKELCYVMFAGIILVNTTLLISAVTSNFVTSDVKVLPAIGFTMIYAALLVKTNRIARLLVIPEHKFVNMNLKYLSLKAQMTITAILIGVEILICWFAIKFNDPDPSMGGSDFILKKYYLNGTFFINIFAFVALLILLSTYYAIKTRNIPTNFNETKCIGFAMYATVITAAAFGLVYFASKQKILAMNLCASINSLTILIFLFSPKLYIIFWTPERNTKVFFSPVTSSMRSFMGNKSRPSARKSSISQCYSLENTGPQSVDDLKEQVRDSIAKVIKELEDILNKRSKTDGGHVGEEKMKKKLKKENLETEDVLQNAYYAEMLKKVKSCHIELNLVQKNYLRSLEDSINNSQKPL